MSPATHESGGIDLAAVEELLAWDPFQAEPRTPLGVWPPLPWDQAVEDAVADAVNRGQVGAEGRDVL